MSEIVGTAFVRVLPVTGGFSALLVAEVEKAVVAANLAAKKATVAQVAQAKVSADAVIAASGAKIAAERNYLREALVSSSAQKVAIKGTVAAAVAAAQTQVAAAAEVTAANVVTAQSIAGVAASYKASAAASMLAARSAVVGQAGAVAASSDILGALAPRPVGPAGDVIGKTLRNGMASTGAGANAARGALIGLSRLTPVTVFGLGAIGVAAIAAGTAIQSAVREAAEFEKQLNTFQAVTGATAAQIAAVRAEALKLGADSQLAGISAGDAAVAMTELSKAGLSVSDSLAAAEGVLQLAGAAEMSAADAARIVATQLNAFGLAGTEATKVVDLLASASIEAQGEISDFSFAFQQVGSVAHQTGVSVGQTTALLTQLAKAGLQGSDAGTSLRTTLLRLTPTTKEARQFTKALGVELDQNRTLGEQLPEVIEKYRSALQVLNPVQRTTVLNQIFGQDAIRAASILTRQNVGELQRLQLALSESGVALELNAAKAKGLSGAWSGLQSTMQTVGVELGSLVSGPLEQFIRGINDTVLEVANLTKALKNLADTPFTVTVNIVSSGWDKLPGFARWGAIGKALTFGPGGFLLPIVVAKKILDQFKVEVPPPPVTGQFNPQAFVRLQEWYSKKVELTPAQIAALRKRVQDTIDGNNKKVSDAISTISMVPPDISLAAINVQMTEGLADDLRNAQDLVAVMEKRLNVALETPGNKPKGDIITAARENLARAKLAEYEIRQQIKSQQDTARDVTEAKNKADREDAAAFSIGNLKRLADEAGNMGAAQDTYIAALKKLWRKQQIGSMARLNALLEVKAAAKARGAATKAAKDATDEANRAAREAFVANVKLGIDLQNARLATQLARAQATPGIADDKRAFQAQIGFNNILLKNLRAEQVGVNKTTKAYREREIQIHNLIDANIGLNKSIKDLADTASGTSAGGFSLQDLFKESLSQFAQFGSNVSTSPMTPGQVRGQFAQGLLSTMMSRPQDRATLGINTVAQNTGDTAKYIKALYDWLTTGQPMEKGSGLLGDSAWGAGLKSSTTAKKLARIGP